VRLCVGLFDPEGDDTTTLRNVGNHWPNDTAYYQGRFECSVLPADGLMFVSCARTVLEDHDGINGVRRHCNYSRTSIMRNKGYSNPITGLDRPLGFQEVEAHRFQDIRHMKVIRLSVLRTVRLYPTVNIPGTHFCYRLSRPQGHSAAGRIMSMKNSNDTIGNRTRDLLAFSSVPQPTAPQREIKGADPISDKQYFG
jgi:hypothetical protein